MKIFLISLLAVFSASAFTAELATQSCEESHLSFNAVMAMKTYSNGQIKVFEIDNIEPAAVPYGVVVTLDRGETLADLESFCRYIPYLSAADVKTTKSSYNPETNTLTLKIKSAQYNPENGGFDDRVLTVKVIKGAKLEADIVKAELN